MSRKRNQVLWEQWRARLARQRAGGLSIMEFCRREGVSPVTFHTWKRRLRDEPKRLLAVRTAAGAARRRPRAVGADAAATVPRIGAFVQLPVVEARPEEWIEVTLTDGTIVRIPPRNLAALRAVCTLLRGGGQLELSKEVPDA